MVKLGLIVRETPMGMLNTMLNRDSITVVAPDGSRRENIRCQFQPPKVIVPDASLDVADGYLVERTLPNGRTDVYVVEDVQFTPGQFGGSPASYELRVRKESAAKPQANPHSIAYNVSGPNARVNIGSADSSVNIARVEVATLFERMRATASEIQEPAAQATVISAINRMESEAGGKGFGARTSSSSRRLPTT